MAEHAHSMHDALLHAPGLLPPGAVGVDAGMTLTKVVRAAVEGIRLQSRETETAAGVALMDGAPLAGVTGARLGPLAEAPGAVAVQEIDAGARGAAALLEVDGRLGDGAFLLALMGTGTAFAAVREGNVSYMGGTPLGGGSFVGIARRIDSTLTYEAMIAAAERGDRRRVDAMISDVYPEGIGRVGPDLTAAHLARSLEGSQDDVLAGLLNLHGENIAQIAAGRATTAQLRRIVLAGGFVHHNRLLVESIAHMARLFGVQVETAPSPGFAGALGAALVAAER